MHGRRARGASIPSRTPRTSRGSGGIHPTTYPRIAYAVYASATPCCDRKATPTDWKAEGIMAVTTPTPGVPAAAELTRRGRLVGVITSTDVLRAVADGRLAPAKPR